MGLFYWSAVVVELLNVFDRVSKDSDKFGLFLAVSAKMGGIKIVLLDVVRVRCDRL